MFQEFVLLISVIVTISSCHCDLIPIHFSLRCITRFSSNYELVLIRNHQPEGNPECYEEFPIPESVASKSPLTILYWPFNHTVLVNLRVEENKRSIFLLNLNNLESLQLVLSMLSEYVSGNLVTKPVFLVMLNDDDFQRFDRKSATNFIPSELIDISCDIYFITSVDNHLKVLELYSIKNFTYLQPVKVTCRGLMNAILIKSTRRLNFFQVPIVLIVQPIDAKYPGGGVMVKVSRKGSKEVRFKAMERLELGEYQYLRDALNFSETGAIEGKGFPHLSESGDGSLTGVAIQLNQNEGDIVVQSIEFTEFRIGKITFLHATSEKGLCAYFKQLPANSMRNIYFDAFRVDLWIVYFSIWIILILAAILMDGLCIKLKSVLRPFGNADESNRSSDHVLRTIGAICQQGWFEDQTHLLGMKMLKFTELLTSMLLYSAYCASIVALFAVPVVPIRSFKDLQSHSFKFYAENYSVAARTLVKELGLLDKSTRNHSLINSTDNYRVITVNKSVELILRTKSAFISPEFMYYPVLADLNYTAGFICQQITEVKNFRSSIKAATILKKGSPFKEIFNLKILQMIERGIRGRNIIIQMNERSMSCLSEHESHKPLELLDISAAFVFIIVGITLSFLVWLLERIHGRYPYLLQQTTPIEFS